MEITDKNIKQVLSGIDRVSAKASNIFNSIDQQALKDANVTDFNATDVANRVSTKVEKKPVAKADKKQSLGMK